MKLLSRYLLRECLGPFLFALGALTGLMILNQIARDFSDLVGKGLSWAIIGEVFALSIPFIVAMTLPMAVLVAALYAFSRLGADNEITALKASGVNLTHTVRPVLVASVGLAIVNFAFNDQVLPRTNHQLRMLSVDIARKKPTFELKEQMVNPVVPGQYYLRAGRIDQSTGRLREVVIYDLGNPDRRRTIYADSGYMRFAETAMSTDLHLTLFDGFVHDYDRSQPAVFRRIFFRTDWVRMRGVSNQFLRSDQDAFKGDREMGVCEMETHVAEQQEILDAARVNTLSGRENDLRGLLGVVNRMTAPGARAAAPHGGPSIAPYCRFVATLTRWLTPTPARADTIPRPRGRAPVGQPRAAAPAVRPALPPPAPAARRPSVDTSGTQLRSRQANVESTSLNARAVLASYRVEIHKKFSIPAMCVVFVLIGAPLALRFPRGGVGLVIGASAGIFGLYYVGLIGGESLADKLLITPFWAMWTPNVLMTAVGLGLFLRLGREHATGRGDGWTERLATLRERRHARRGGAR